MAACTKSAAAHVALSTSPTDGKNMRWSFSSSESTKREVGADAPKNQKIPKAMGRCSRRFMHQKATISRAMQNAIPIRADGSDNDEKGWRSVSALSHSGKNNDLM